MSYFTTMFHSYNKLNTYILQLTHMVFHQPFAMKICYTVFVFMASFD